MHRQKPAVALHKYSGTYWAKGDTGELLIISVWPSDSAYSGRQSLHLSQVWSHLTTSGLEMAWAYS